MTYHRQSTLEDYDSTWESEPLKQAPTPKPKPTIQPQHNRKPKAPLIDVVDGRVNIRKFTITIRGEP